MTEQTTSRQLILARINSDRQYAHFKSWKEGEKRKAIGDCGLAQYIYGNKEKRNEVLSHLASCDLPLDADEVREALKSRGIIFLHSSTSQQLAALLLTHLAPGLTPAPAPVAVNPIMTPPTQLVANQARIVCWSRMSGVDNVPSVYKKQEHLWRVRRQAWAHVPKAGTGPQGRGSRGQRGQKQQQQQ